MQWLIDGHNLIGQMPNLRLDDAHDEEELLEYLRRYRARTGHTVTVVFDAGQDYQPAKTHQQGGITVQFVRQGQTADQVLIRRIHQVKNPQAVMVVTSDREVEQAARQARIRVVSAQEFARRLHQPTSLAEEKGQTDIELSPDEVDEWLTIFNRRRDIDFD